MALQRRLSDDDRLAWLRLARTPNIGPSTFAALMGKCGDIHNALSDAAKLARRGGKELKIESLESAKRELDAVEKLHGRIIANIEPDFPSALAAIDVPPPVITVIGRTDLLARDTLSIVGARNASALGVKFAQDMASQLSAAGWVIASGMARGIDRVAHEAALPGGTIAVLAGGADIIYPPENQSLYRSLAENGAILPEMALGTTPQARHFPRRNRIISGLSRGVVVVEAAERSGSLITASYALEQGREIFAVPGSPLDPRSKGSNRLLKDGATMATCVDDVLAALNWAPAPSFLAEDSRHTNDDQSEAAFQHEPDDSLRGIVLEKLSAAPVEIDELVRQTGAPAPAVLTILLELELAARIQRHPGARVSWI